MQPATDETVLGDFNDAVFEHDGVATRFFRRDGAFLVETQGPDGQRREYEAKYTFGVVPLQQYLLEMPRGRYQAFTVAWDARSSDEGGQRWFHLHPDEHTPPGDELHWGAPAYTWNFACAECHSTNLRKNYEASSDTYATTWSEIDVSCEACHGPGSRHVDVARIARDTGMTDGYPKDHGLLLRMTGPGAWKLEPGAATAWLTTPLVGAPEIDACGRCHARRSQITDEYVYGKPLSETHRVQLLTDPHYFPDGQIEDEVFVYASYRQSLMHDKGVTCTDCHEPHSLRLRAEGNDLCATCHAPSVYDVQGHHFHEPGTRGASCVECHMPTRTYMGVDPRRDHSIRIPRPDLTVAMGVPNACNACHTDQSAEWSVEAMDRWYGTERRPGHQAFAQTLADARRGAPAAGAALEALALDEAAPVVARATALEELAGFIAQESIPAVQAGLGHDDPLMRRAAIEAIESVDPASRWALIRPLLSDPVLGVRLAAAAALSDIRPAQVEPEHRETLERAFEAYAASERSNADRAEHRVNLGEFRFRQGDIASAEAEFGAAIERDPSFVPAYANLADMYRVLGREDDAERTLRRGIEATPQSPHLHHALGLLLVRTQRHADAMASLARAYELGAADPRMGYVYGVALDSSGRSARAIEVWEDVATQHPNDADVLGALVGSLQRAGESERARVYEARLRALSGE
jgi:predicted CXXCH cytochrome family protein